MPFTDVQVRAAMDVVDRSSGIVAGLRAADDLAMAASRADDPAAAARDLAARIGADGGSANGDQLAVVAALHALSAVDDDVAMEFLTDALFDGRWYVTEHAAWALSARRAHRPALGRLAALVAAGGFRAMLAQRTLGAWAPAVPEDAHRTLAGALRATAAPSDRKRLVETLGLVPGRPSTERLVELAADDAESVDVRIAAIGALGDRDDSDGRLLAHLASGDDDLARHALLALSDRAIAGAAEPDRRSDGLHIAQLYLHADIAGALMRSGAGDNGGIATLLAMLSECLVELPEVASVVTIGRGSSADALAEVWQLPRGARLAAVPFGPPGPVELRSAWPYRIAVERGLRRILRGDRRPEVLHLRMADVGTLAAAAVARRLRIPTVFTAAPDPHVVMRAGELDGTLARENFGERDELEHWWFRARMVERLTSQSDRIALLPRPAVREDLLELLGHDIDDDPRRSAVIPEGVHARTIRAAASAVRAADPGAWPPGLDALVDALRELPPERHGLPSIVAVGRLHPAKGIERVAAAWAGDEHLHATTNLVIVGGDLERPSADELDVLNTLDDLFADHRGDGAVLLGHRPHGDVARLLAGIADGVDPLLAGRGIYVGAARKEEFGLAIAEGLAAGLPVVAPEGGGPPTYVRDGVTGILADTSSVQSLGAAIVRALSLIDVPGRAESARRDVLEHLTIERMARRLVELYLPLRRGPT